jgi:hypothetical protein
VALLAKGDATGSVIASNPLLGLEVGVVDQSSSNNTVVHNFGFRDAVGLATAFRNPP